MAGYLIANIEVADPKGFDEYRQKVAPLIAKFGGRYIVHFGDVVAFEGATPNDIVIIAFDSMDKAQAWRASKAFKNLVHPARSIRNIRTFAVAGVTQ